MSAVETRDRTLPLPSVQGKALPPAAQTNSNAAGSLATPQPYTHVATSKSLMTSSISIHGVHVEFAVRTMGHVNLIHEHVRRETNGYAILKDAILLAKQAQPAEPPLVMDVGSNHGIYSLFAAALGADVITLEPQSHLCRVINKAAQLNGPKVASHITVYHNAALDHSETVTLSRAQVAEGAIATVVREGKAGGGTEKVQARPISYFYDAYEKQRAPKPARRVAFLKVDVEGFELHAISSANTVFAKQMVDTMLVEFGPPNRWSSAAGDSAKSGQDLLATMNTKYGMEPRLIDSLVWRTFMQTPNARDARDIQSESSKLKYVSLATSKRQTMLIDAMAKCCEAYVWFVRDAPHKVGKYRTFESKCGNSGFGAASKFGCN